MHKAGLLASCILQQIKMQFKIHPIAGWERYPLPAPIPPPPSRCTLYPLPTHICTTKVITKFTYNSSIHVRFAFKGVPWKHKLEAAPCRGNNIYCIAQAWRRSLSNSRTEIHFSLHKSSYTEISILVPYFMNDITALQRQLKRATINAMHAVGTKKGARRSSRDNTQVPFRKGYDLGWCACTG